MNNSPSNISYILLLLERYQAVLAPIGMNGLKLRRPNTWNGNQPVNLNMLASTSVN